MRLPDADVEKYLKLLTFYSIPEIQQIMETHNEDPSKRVAQHKLASQFVELVHGHIIAEKVEQQHRLIFSSRTRTSIDVLPTQEAGKTGAFNMAVDKTAPPVNAFSGITPHVTLPRSLVENQFFHKVLYHAGMVSSKAEGYRLIVKNGAHVGSMPDSKNEMGDALAYIPIRTWPAEITKNFIIDDSLMILKVGKWKVKIIKIISDQEFEEQGLTCPGWKEETNVGEKIEDRQLFQNTKKIKGKRVKLPRNAQDEKDGDYEVVSWLPSCDQGEQQDGHQGEPGPTSQTGSSQ